MHSDFGVFPSGRLAFSVAEAAQLTGLGRTTIYAMIGRGELPSHKIGKRRLIAAAGLVDLMTPRTSVSFS